MAIELQRWPGPPRPRYGRRQLDLVDVELQRWPAPATAAPRPPAARPGGRWAAGPGQLRGHHAHELAAVELLQRLAGDTGRQQLDLVDIELQDLASARYGRATAAGSSTWWTLSCSAGKRPLRPRYGRRQLNLVTIELQRWPAPATVAPRPPAARPGGHRAAALASARYGRATAAGSSTWWPSSCSAAQRPLRPRHGRRQLDLVAIELQRCPAPATAAPRPPAARLGGR